MVDHRFRAAFAFPAEGRVLASKSFRVLLLAALGALTGACAARAPSSGAAGDAPATSQSPARRDPMVIAMDELSDPALRGQSVLEVVRVLRPNFLSNRGIQSRVNPEAGRVHASINGIGVVSLDELRTMHLAGVVEIRFLNAAAAMQKFGGAAQEGPVILVRTM